MQMSTLSPAAQANARLLIALPVLKAAALAGELAGERLPAADAPVATDLGNGLGVAYVVEQDDHFSYVQQRDLAVSGFNPEGLHECAIGNLAARCEGKAEVQPHGPIHGVFFDGMFEASLLLVDALWDVHLAHLAPNGFVATLPSRDVLAFCDARSPQGIAVLRSMAARVSASGTHLLTSQLYTRRGGKWVPFAQAA